MRMTPRQLLRRRLRAGPPRPRGLTLVEMLLALASTALIGAAIASMLVAVSYGTSSSHDMRSVVIKHKALSSRINAAMRQSRMVLDAGEGWIVLWVNDDNGDEKPSWLEWQRLEWDGAADTLRSFLPVIPDGWTQETVDLVNASYELDRDFGAITAAWSGLSSFPGVVWATRIEDWSLALDDADPQAATLISYQFDARIGAEATTTDTMIGAAALRNE